MSLRTLRASGVTPAEFAILGSVTLLVLWLVFYPTLWLGWAAFHRGAPGDTGPCSALEELAGGAHLLLAEASFRSGDDNPPDLHMTGADCGRTASVAGVERLVLTALQKTLNVCPRYGWPHELAMVSGSGSGLQRRSGLRPGRPTVVALPDKDFKSPGQYCNDAAPTV